MSENTNERLHELLVKQIEKFDGAVDKSVDFAMAHAPELVQQLLLWHGIRSFTCFFAGILILMITYAIYRKSHKKWRESIEKVPTRQDLKIEDLESEWPLFLFFMIPAGFGASIMFLSLTWLKIIIAPKLYLFEYAAALVK